MRQKRCVEFFSIQMRKQRGQETEEQRFLVVDF